MGAVGENDLIHGTTAWRCRRGNLIPWSWTYRQLFSSSLLLYFILFYWWHLKDVFLCGSGSPWPLSRHQPQVPKHRDYRCEVPCLPSLACKLLLVTVCGRNLLNSCSWAYIFFFNLLLVRSYIVLSQVNSVVSASLHASSEQQLLLNFATWAKYLFGAQILLWRK